MLIFADRIGYGGIIAAAIFLAISGIASLFDLINTQDARMNRWLIRATGAISLMMAADFAAMAFGLQRFVAIGDLLVFGLTVILLVIGIAREGLANVASLFILAIVLGNVLTPSHTDGVLVAVATLPVGLLGGLLRRWVTARKMKIA